MKHVTIKVKMAIVIRNCFNDDKHSVSLLTIFFTGMSSVRFLSVIFKSDS